MAKVVAKKTAAKKPAAKKTACKGECKKTAAKKAAPVKAAVEAPKKIRKVSKPKNDKTLSYTQSEFIENVQGFCGFAKRSQAKEFCDDMALLIKEALKKGYRLPLLGLGKMYVRKTKACVKRNPATGAPVNVPAKKKVRFIATKALKDAVI